jgi:sugar phosphate isomerase/epimerase
MWTGLVGKGDGGEPPIELDRMLELTAGARAGNARFDGVDLFLFEPHVSIDAGREELKRLAEKVTSRGMSIGSVVAPIWPATGGGSAMGDDSETARFIGQVEKACRIASEFRSLGVRTYGVIRIDSACTPADWARDPEANSRRIADTFSRACDVAERYDERLAAEGEICWGGMHSWRRMAQLLETVNRPRTLGFQADMAHTVLYTLGYNAPEDRLLPENFDWNDRGALDEALRKVSSALRPWTIDFHVAQNDGTVKGSGSHDKTGRHCPPDDPNGKLELARHAGFWMRNEGDQPTRAFEHICWDGCMFSNRVLEAPETWNKVLQKMVDVRDANGWDT